MRLLKWLPGGRLACLLYSAFESLRNHGPKVWSMEPEFQFYNGAAADRSLFCRSRLYSGCTGARNSSIEDSRYGFEHPIFLKCIESQVVDLSNTNHAFEFLESDIPISTGVVVLFGDENFLKAKCMAKIKSELLQGEEAELNLIKLSGPSAEMKDIRDELSTISLFGGGGQRMVIVEDAEKFVSEHRDELESFVANAPSSGVLVLDVGQWRSNTRLYKAVDKTGLQVDCRPPMRGKNVNCKQIAKWMAVWGKEQHGLKIKQIVVEHMIDLVGPELGLLDQNLAKLSLYLDSKTAVTEEHVNEYVGGWQTKSIWDLIDTAISGHSGAAIAQLDRLFQNGDAPQALFGQISWSLRRYAMAFDEAKRFTRHGRRVDVDEVMTNAGFRFPPEKKKAMEQLKRIGREKGGQYYRILLECDLALKASHSSMPRSRIALERLIFDLIDVA